METTKRIVILLILVVLTSVPAAAFFDAGRGGGRAQSAEKPAAAQISNTRTASCVVKITSDPMVLPLDDAIIDYLLHSTNVGGKVAREVLDISPDQVSGIFKVEALVGAAGRIPPEPLPRQRPAPTDMGEYEMMETERDTSSIARPGSSRGRPTTSRAISAKSQTSAAEQTIVFRLSVELPKDVKPAAEEFMDALVVNLGRSLLKAFEDYKVRFGDQLQLAEEEAMRAEVDLRDKQRTLREISGSHVLDRDKILTDIYRLRQEVQTAKMNQASNQVIIDETTKRIAETQAKIKKQLGNDEITVELQKIVELSGKLVLEAEREADMGRISRRQLDEIKEKLARAKIEIARRREQLSNSIGGNLIESLNKELADRSIQATQDEASIRSLEQQLAQAESLLAKADDYELLSLKADIAKQNLQESILWRDRISRQIRLLQPPMVSILGGE